MKTTETQQKVLDHIEKFSDSNAGLIAAATGLNKLLVFKTVKVLAENKLIEINAENKTYKIMKQNSDSKKNDEVKLQNPNGRSTAKYIFNKQSLPKSRLVLEVMRQFISDNKRYSLEKVQEIWKSDELQKRYGTIVTVSRAKKFCEGGRERHFMKDPITIGKQKVVISNQWSEELLIPFLKIASSLKYKITKE